MGWTLPTRAHQRFHRNPLAAVIVQLRFDPILKVAAGVPDFQEKIRSRFPMYEEREVQLVEVELPASAAVRTRSVKEYRFQARGEPATVVLGDQSVSLEYRNHQHRDVLFPDVGLVVAALAQTFANVSPTRLGVRYVNAVDKAAIGAALGQEVDWGDLLDASFLTIPAGLADLEGTRFGIEITSPMPVGAMTLRYGLLPASDGRTVFRLDTDRYRQEAFSVGDVEKMVETFANDIFQVFMAAAGKSLLTWMEAQQ